MTIHPDVERILSFWFDRDPMDWMRAPEGFDAQCKSEFEHLVLKARDTDELDAWATDSPQGSLALVVLLDQLTRNIFRGSADAYSGDAKAADIASRAILTGFDNEVTVIQATAFYIALLHQEDLESVGAVGSLCEALKSRCATDEERDWVDKGIGAAKMHADLIGKFGRYPGRNAILGRKNTEAEDRFLEEFPSGFP